MVMAAFQKMEKNMLSLQRPDKFTPAPWINVLANPHFGSIISESGQIVYLDR